MIDVIEKNVRLKKDDLSFELEILNSNEDLKKFIVLLYEEYCICCTNTEQKEKLKNLLLEIEKEILRSREIDLSFFYTLCIPFANKDAHEEILLSKRFKLPIENYFFKLFSPFYAYLYALNYVTIKKLDRDIERKDIEKFENIVLESGIPRYIYLFARDIKDANIDALQEKIFECKISGGIDEYLDDEYSDKYSDDEYSDIYLLKFANDIKGANIRRLEKVILDSNSSSKIYNFAYHVKGADIDALQKKLLKIKDSDSHQRCYEFARNIKGADIKELEAKILNINELDSEPKFGLLIEDNKDEELKLRTATLEEEKYMLRNRHLELCYFFARDVEGANIQALGQKIIESKNLELNLNFAKYVKGADIEAHKKVIFESGNIGYMFEIAQFADKIQLNVPDNLVKSLKRERKKYWG